MPHKFQAWVLKECVCINENRGSTPWAWQAHALGVAAPLSVDGWNGERFTDAG